MGEDLFINQNFSVTRALNGPNILIGPCPLSLRALSKDVSKSRGLARIESQVGL